MVERCPTRASLARAAIGKYYRRRLSPWVREARAAAQPQRWAARECEGLGSGPGRRSRAVWQVRSFNGAALHRLHRTGLRPRNSQAPAMLPRR
jgi:hypothetical protein